MKVAIIASAAGAPGTLASTAFIRALADGFTQIRIPVRIVGLTPHPAAWVHESMEPYDTATPWLNHPTVSPRDGLAAARLGVLDEFTCGEPGGPAYSDDWHLELLLQRELEAYAGDDSDLVVLAYPRIYSILRPVARVVRRCGWKLVIPCVEALSDVQIDPATRDDYIRCVVNCADGVWSLSEYLAEYWHEQGVPLEQIVVHPPAVRAASFLDTPPPRAHRVVYIGNLRHKEIDYLLEIFQLVMQQVPGCSLTLYGDATLDRHAELEREIAELGIGHAISIVPPVMPAEVPSILEGADVLVLPRSHGEFSTAGFPNKLGEYLATGRPVVVTAVGDIPKYLVDRQSAMLVEPDDCSAFASALVRVLQDEALASTIGRGGKDVAAAVFASSEVAGKLARFFDTLRIREPEATRPLSRPSRLLRLIGASISVPAIIALERFKAWARTVGLRRRLNDAIVRVKIAVVAVLRLLHLKKRPPER